MKLITFTYIFFLYILLSPQFLFKFKNVNPYLLNLIMALLFTFIIFMSYDLVNNKEGFSEESFKININNYQPASMVRDKYIKYYEDRFLQTKLESEKQLSDKVAELNQAEIDYNNNKKLLKDEQNKLNDEITQMKKDGASEIAILEKEKELALNQQKTEYEKQIQELKEEHMTELTNVQSSVTTEFENTIISKDADIKKCVDDAVAAAATAKTELDNEKRAHQQANRDLTNSRNSYNSAINERNSARTERDNYKTSIDQQWTQGWNVMYWVPDVDHNDPRRRSLFGYGTYDSEIYYNWGSGGPVLGSGRYDYIWLEINCFIWFPHDVNVYFRMGSDDGSYLYFNNKRVINNWRAHGTVWKQSGALYMKANKRYPLCIEWYEWGGGANLYLQWYIPGHNSGWTTVARQYFNRVS